jgi:hypothetical protein
MISLRCKRPYDENADWTTMEFDGDEEESLLGIVLATLGRQDWEMEQAIDGEWEPLEVEE